MRTRLEFSGALLLSLAVAVGLTACADPYPLGGVRAIPAAGPGPGGPWGMRGGPGMRGHGPGMGGYGPGMRGYGPGMRGYGGMMGGPGLRHRWAMMQGIPASYQGLRDPLPADQRVITEGRALFLANCSSCHGDQGEGDGPAAAGLSPPPANLRWTVRRPMAGDGYLMWAIGEGGIQMGSAMPAFKDTLSEADRWKIIRFLRSL